jgi:hypothetical protein
MVNEATMDSFFDASPVTVAEFARNLHRDTEVLQAGWNLSLFGANLNAGTFGSELALVEIEIHDCIETRAGTT